MLNKMKKTIAVLAGFFCLTAATAQQVNTMYFLENAPMRHLTNPAFQPVSDGYIALIPGLGYNSMWFGNNSLSISDLLYYNQAGKLVTPFHPDEDREAFLRKLRRHTTVSADEHMNLFSFGFRYRDKGYITIGIDERISIGSSTPKSINNFLFNGGMRNPEGISTLNLKGATLGVEVYTEIYGGYSHKINDQWTVGGKLKVLLGTAYIGSNSKNMRIDASSEEWRLYGTSSIYAAAPLNWDALPEKFDRETLENYIKNNEYNKLIPSMSSVSDYMKLLAPSGIGAAVDLGMTYKPHEQVQITAALNDLGFIYWNKAARLNLAMDTTFTGIGDFEYSKYVDQNNTFQTDSLMRDITNNMLGLIDGAITSRKGFARMASARLNVGVDANFWNNRVGVGLVSSTRLYNNHFYEELTLGAAFRPVNWFNLAVSYSMINNGKGSSLGAGISLMPYDGINLTIAADYIPTNYAYLKGDNISDDLQKVPLPYHMKGVNLAFGLSIVWGTNKKRDSDKDGVLDKWDMCPGTPKGVRVDTLGCPLDSDGDGVPDYMDECIETPGAAYGWVDEHGCPTDEDLDSVPDYKDECPGTPVEARAYVDEKGCDKDSDGDGVPDFIDQCPNSPAGAVGYVDSVGCEIDSDGDGVPDWRDRCPNTPVEAYGMIDENGCELDTDEDGVPDWKDRCPYTPKAARGFVDEMGCLLDTDGDGVFDYEDECPKVPGVKENKGCPALKRSYVNILKKAMSGIQFETGKAVIKTSSNTILNQVADIFLEDESFTIEVQGHTDNVGKSEANKVLSQKRAEAVLAYMVKRGVAADRLTAVGYGDERPIADNNTSAGRAQNRRVEFDLTYLEKVEEVVLDHADPVVEPTTSENNSENK